ncbi:HS12A-like protein [Mya arenaria]|uniref:HS12A-like protein n=1 Tax=Mya arenaria TaxID=6604 RepID=A0ABY7G6H0_MYAAR|nr:HS12A-like protein [Mya arenaria]
MLRSQQFFDFTSSNCSAGIDKNNLILAQGAKAGSVYWKYLALQTPGQDAQNLFEPGCRFVVLDLGGGTVHFTAYEVDSDESLSAILKPCGEDWGGNMVNAAYIEMLWRIFGKDMVEKFQQDNQEDFLDIQNEFESKKREFTEAGQTVHLKLPNSVVLVVEKHSTVSSLIGKAGLDDDVDFASGKLSVSGKMFSEFFKKTTKDIVRSLQHLLDSAEVHNSIDKLLLVGGFSQSPVVRNAVQDAFPLIPIYCPEDAELAILKGAVILGHKPKLLA